MGDKWWIGNADDDPLEVVRTWFLRDFKITEMENGLRRIYYPSGAYLDSVQTDGEAREYVKEMLGCE